MKIKYLCFLIFFLIVPISFADITIKTDQHIYNLGDKISASASTLHDKNFEGLFKLMLLCGTYKLDYFLTPISLESNFRTAVNVPELLVTQSMIGNCTISGDLINQDNLVIEEGKSNSFIVTEQLVVRAINKNVMLLPGDRLQLVGIVNEAFGNNILTGSTKISLGNSSYEVDSLGGKFNLTIEIPRNIKTGNHIITIVSSDSKGNSGTSFVELEITAIPSYIKTDLTGSEFLPGSKIGIRPSLYDQADDLINTSLDVELASPSGNKIFRKNVISNEEIEYEFSQYAEPGLYNLVTTYKKLLVQSLINVTKIRQVKIVYDNESVYIENVGNVPFEDELKFTLQGIEKNYPITKKIKVEPGKTLNIDLSKEVPFGIYNINIPKLHETFDKVSSLIDQKVVNFISNKENILAANVTIHDNRPIYKKITSGISSITGNLVGSGGILTKSPIIAPAILIVVVLLIVLRYAKNPLMRFIRRKKEDENNEKEN